MVDFDVEFCPHCGEYINYIANTCPICCEELPDNALFCPHCGEEVWEDCIVCYECGEEITEENVEEYNQLSQKEKTDLREAYLKKKSEEMAAEEAVKKEVAEKRIKDREQYNISKAQDEALINEITDEIKSQITFDCKLKVSFTLTYIEIQAIIVDTGYTLSKNILQKNRAKALSQFVQALIAIHEVTGK